MNTLWPRTTIATAAIKNLLGGDIVMQRSRKPDIIADAAYALFQKPVSFTGNFLIDDTFLAGEGVTDFEKYRVDPSQPLQVDIFMPDSPPPPQGRHDRRPAVRLSQTPRGGFKSYPMPTLLLSHSAVSQSSAARRAIPSGPTACARSSKR